MGRWFGSYPQNSSLEDRVGPQSDNSEFGGRSPQAAIVDTRSFGYFLIHDRTEATILLYFMPQEIQDSYSPVWNDQVIPGRSEPIRSYAHGGPRHVACNLVFMAQGGTEELVGGAKAEVYDPVTLIRSAMYPRYSTTVDAPPLVSLWIGKFLRIKGILKQAEVRWMGPWDVIGGMWPMRAELSITIDEVNPRALGRADITADRRR